MFKNLKLEKYLKVNLIKSLLINRYVESKNSTILPLLLYGNLKTYIHKSSKIFINNGTLHLNSSFRNIEPFPSVIEMMPNSRLTINGNFSLLSGGTSYNC